MLNPIIVFSFDISAFRYLRKLLFYLLLLYNTQSFQISIENYTLVSCVATLTAHNKFATWYNLFPGMGPFKFGPREDFEGLCCDMQHEISAITWSHSPMNLSSHPCKYSTFAHHGSRNGVSQSYETETNILGNKKQCFILCQNWKKNNYVVENNFGESSLITENFLLIPSLWPISLFPPFLHLTQVDSLC